MATSWTPPHGWWDDYPADKEETTVKTTCQCDGDYDYERGSYRATHVLCPVHDNCVVCDEAKAVIIVDGDKCCAACATEEIQACPNCNWDAGFTEHSATSREPHGETHDDVWLVCKHCGKQTDDQELKDYNAARLERIREQLQEVVGK